MALVPKTVLMTVGTTAASLFGSGAVPRACGSLVISAPSTNTANVFVGGVDVDYATEKGILVAKGTQVVLTLPHDQHLDLSKLWADSGDADEQLAITYWETV